MKLEHTRTLEIPVKCVNTSEGAPGSISEATQAAVRLEGGVALGVDCVDETTQRIQIGSGVQILIQRIFRGYAVHRSWIEQSAYDR